VIESLVDTNIILYAHRDIDPIAIDFIERNAIGCSIVSQIEALGFAGIRPNESLLLTSFFGAVPTFALTDEIAAVAIALRRRRRLKLGDSIIAATALVHGLTLATRNVADFAWIGELRVVNPYADRS
jgi:toxin FitB